MSSLFGRLKEVHSKIVPMLIDSSLDELFIEKVLLRLESFGYLVENEDSWPIAYSIQKVENIIKNTCNISTVPEGLISNAIDRVCGEFLNMKIQTGQAKEFINLEVAVKQVNEGDTSVVFAISENSKTPEDKMNAFISYLVIKGESDFVCYRKIKW